MEESCRHKIYCSAPDNYKGKLFAIFPEEIWSQILGNVDNLNDFYGIRIASHLLQDILSEHRIRILFPSVFKVLVKQCAIQHREKLAGVTEDDDNEDFEKWIGFTDLVPLRQVCQSWKKGMDTLLQNTVFEFEFPNKHMSIDGQAYDEIDDYYTRAFEFTCAEDFKRFRDYFDATHLENGKVNPFPTRKVDIIPPDDDDRGERDQFYYQLVCFLQEYGIHIWYFMVDGNDIGNALGLIRIYNNLGLFLKLVPNLKILWIHMQDTVLSADQEKQVMESYQHTLFPRLENLEYINQLGMPVSSFIELTKTPFPKLQQLGINVANKNDLVAFLGNSTQIPVKKLELNVGYVQESWEAVFNATARQCGETLEQLYVILARPPDADYALTGKLSFHKLRVLYLKMEMSKPLDFILGVAETLERLCLKFYATENCRFEQAEKEERVVKFYGYLNKLHRSLPCLLHKSNIWILFPKLQSLDVWSVWEKKDKPSWTCTREDWQRKNEQIDDLVTHV